MSQMTSRTAKLLFLCALLASPSVAAQPPAPSVRRFALVVGANNGGTGRVPLRYATDDARAVARVFEDLGGVAAGDRLLVLEPDRAAFLDALARLSTRVERGRSSSTRLELLLYYSGHSDEHGLLLRGERLRYEELRQRLGAMPADVRIAILDSCASGALTRLKGGVHRPPFVFDTSTRVHGHAYLTSSSEDEAAQESDQIRGSYFTHFLVSGLRGGADLSRDRRVTLNEVYQFAFNETLARTTRTQGGTQHPTYDIQLAGSGDLVLTDLRGTAATMVIEADIGGRLSIRDQAGRLVAELTKPAGRVVELGLDPGEYHVALAQAPRLFEARVRLARGARTRVSTGILVAQSAEPTIRRGEESTHAEPPSPKYRVVPLNLAVVPEWSLDGRRDGAINYVALNLVYGDSAKLRGLAMGVGASIVREDAVGVQLSSGFNMVGSSLKGLQISAGANRAGADSSGGQLAAGFNWASDAYDGAQLAAALNRLGGSSRGLQLAAGGNLAEEYYGLQLAAGLNYARALGGAQIGIINIGGDMDGAQIGVVNIARRARGLQLGVLNIAEDSTTPVGVLNLIKNGEHHLEVWGSETLPMALSVKLGGKRVYGILTAAMNPGTDPLRWAYGGGIGVHSPLGRVFIDVDGMVLTVHSGSREATGPLSTWRLTVGYRVAQRFAVFGGPSFNVFASDDTSGPDISFGPLKFYETADHTVRLWAGFFLGVQV